MVNETLVLMLEPLVQSLGSAVGLLKTAMGGIFGLYAILVILRWREARMVRKLLVEVRNELKRLNKKVLKIEAKIL